MQPDFPPQPPDGTVRLKPATVLIGATPDVVCMSLLRYAANPASVSIPAEVVDQLAGARWQARRHEGKDAVTFLLLEGSFAHYRLQFSLEPDESGSSLLWVTGEYTQRRSLLHGMLERWQAQREAEALRDGVLAILKVTATKPVGAEPPAIVRGSERLSVRAPARLHVGNHTWHAEVLDVSETGMALLATTVPSQAVEDARTLLTEEIGEIEVLLLGEKSRMRVLVKRATPSRGGVEIGVQVIDAEGMVPLLRRALAKAKPSV